jgi:hypothetical protein
LVCRPTRVSKRIGCHLKMSIIDVWNYEEFLDYGLTGLIL